MTPIQKIIFPVGFSNSCVAMAPFLKRAIAITSAQITISLRPRALYGQLRAFSAAVAGH